LGQKPAQEVANPSKGTVTQIARKQPTRLKSTAQEKRYDENLKKL
jgi:hypothetical protein